MAVTNSTIEWTDSTWSPVTGCDKVSAGCDHCYAETIANRFAGTKAFPRGFAITLRPERLDQPLKWRKPRRIFVNSMSDLFHDNVPDEFIAEVFAVMALAPQHTFQLLTKRHGRMRSLLGTKRFATLVTNRISKRNPYYHQPTLPLPNVWLGVSVEDQKWADIRIPALLEAPAAVRWLSCEPLLGPVELPLVNTVDGCTCGHYGPHEPTCGLEPGPAWGNLHWVVAGGESGPGSRPMHPDWARSLRDQCVGAGIPFFFKQWGEWCDSSQMPADTWSWLDSAINLGQEQHPEPHRVGKKRAGRLLDERTWDEYPSAS